METGSGGSPRRVFIQGAAALLGGMAGVAACGQAGSGPPPPETAPLPPPTGTWTLLGSGRVLASAPWDGVVDADSVAFGGEILEPASGGALGSFRFQALGPAGAALGLGDGLELQSLHLAEGAIYAVAVAAGDRADRSYAVLGGTGRYAGARGACRVHESGTGLRRSMTFTLTLS